MDPWSKGDYSRHIPETIMVMERSPEVNPPSGRVPGQLLLAIPRSKSRRRQNNGRNRVTELSRGFLEREINIGQRGASGVAPLAQAARWRGHPTSRASRAPGQGVAPLGASFGLLESSIVDIFW